MATIISNSAAETAALGEAWGRAAEPGWIIALSGDLGAGKTQLAKGIARGLGIVARVHSPTFALVNEYTGGRLPLVHIDLYRLEARGQIEAAGLADCLTPAGVAVIEWAERWWGGPPGARGRGPAGWGRWRRVTLETLSEESRRITYEDSGD